MFTPIQPTVRMLGGPVSYKEVMPSSSLQNMIYCYWSLRTEEKLSSDFTYRVVADGCIDIFLDMDNRQDVFVMGFCRKYTEFSLSSSFHYVGIRFLPSMFTQLYGIDASLLSDKYLELRDVIPALYNVLSEEVDGVSGFSQWVERVNERLEFYAANITIDVDNRFYDALDIILNCQGVLSVEKDLRTGLSPRQLRRVFNYYLGTTPKTFGKVVRFQNILRAKPSTQSLRQNKLFYDIGYYDQAHFIKEFKSLYGVVPSVAFGRG